MPARRSSSLWWFPYPLIAGTFGPIASAFSICALVVPWRALTPTRGSEEHGSYIDDSKWVTGVNATQLATALVSNLFLFLNMAGRVRFPIAQPIIIVGWYISSILLVALTAAVAVSLSSRLVLTQAYYYAVFAAALYFFVATIMVITVFGFYKGHYDEEFKLTVRRRSLMIQTTGFLGYLLLGAAVYARVEHWEYLDAVYFVDYTILTVGIGDFAPTTHLGRSLLFPFATGGVIIFGLVICTIRSLVVDRGREKLGATMVERRRQRVLNQLEKGKRSETMLSVGDTICQTISITEPQRSRQEFELMRQIQDQVASRRRWTALLLSAVAWFVLWLVSASIFKNTEKEQAWSYFDALYFTFTSLLTIGYGDLYPTSAAGRAFFVFWSLLAVPSLTILVSHMGDTIVRYIRDILLWAGNLAFFAPEEGVKAPLRRAVCKLSGGKMFGDRPDDTYNHHNQMSQDSDQRFLTRATHRLPHVVRGAVTETKPEASIESMHGRHYHLIKEVSTLLTHTKSVPPKRFTYDEWGWYLKLLGEDEPGAGPHNSPVGKLEVVGESMETTIAASSSHNGQAQIRGRWSWIGDQSPLMANIGEPEWVLERLLATLERELKDARMMSQGQG